MKEQPLSLIQIEKVKRKTGINPGIRFLVGYDFIARILISENPFAPSSGSMWFSQGSDEEFIKLKSKFLSSKNSYFFCGTKDQYFR